MVNNVADLTKGTQGELWDSKPSQEEKIKTKQKTKPRILIVEDERIVAKDIQNKLEGMGYKVVDILSTGEEAIKRAKKLKPSLILMDIKLKGDVDGIRAAEAINRENNIPVVYLTAYSDNNTLERAKLTKPFGYIIKPFEDRDLYTTIEIALYKSKIEEKLRKSEEKYRLLVETMNEGITLADENSIITYVNKQACDMVGYREDELIGRCFDELLNPDSKKILNKQVEFRKQGKTDKYELPVVTKSGKVVHFLISPRPIINKKGEFKGNFAVTMDITDRKRAEEDREKFLMRLIQDEKMAGVGSLTDGVAHEFNNILQIMGGYAQYADQTDDIEELKKALRIISQISDKGMKIVNNLSSFSKQNTMELCYVHELLEMILSLVEKQLKKSNIMVKRDYGRSCMLQVSKAEIQQVFLNLINNARDAMLPDGGELTISVKESGETVEISFQDTGRGIKESDINRLFEPFYTTKGALGNDKIPGVGLGLYVSYGIIKNHGGSIDIKSSAGQGSKVSIKLPLKEIKVDEAK